jgi:hypothetical protein
MLKGKKSYWNTPESGCATMPENMTQFTLRKYRPGVFWMVIIFLLDIPMAYLMTYQQMCIRRMLPVTRLKWQLKL